MTAGSKAAIVSAWQFLTTVPFQAGLTEPADYQGVAAVVKRAADLEPVPTLATASKAVVAAVGLVGAHKNSKDPYSKGQEVLAMKHSLVILMAKILRDETKKREDIANTIEKMWSFNTPHATGRGSTLALDACHCWCGSSLATT